MLVRLNTYVHSIQRYFQVLAKWSEILLVKKKSGNLKNKCGGMKRSIVTNYNNMNEAIVTNYKQYEYFTSNYRNCYKIDNILNGLRLDISTYYILGFKRLHIFLDYNS